MLNLHLKTAAEVEPIELDDLKMHIGITGTDEDDYLSSSIIPSARASAENDLDLALITQTREWVWDGGFPKTGQLRFPVSPLQSVTAVKYIDTDGVTQTWADTNYHVETRGQFGRLWLADGISWPTDIQPSRPGVAWIEFVAGYGANPDDVPANIRNMTMMMAAHIYGHRDPTITGTIIQEVPEHLLKMVWQNRAYDFELSP